MIVISDNFKTSDSFISIDIHNENITTQLISKQHNGTYRIRYKGTAFNVLILSTEAHRLNQYMIEKPKLDTSKVILSPMPGVIKSVAVNVGDLINEGQECCVVEAMKMQNSLKAGITGTVKAVNAKEGDTVEEEQILVEIE
ncbi:PCCA [Lepeophtheirus salmonis]|nr:PCCA [Lepeophtheirus salmonis]CAF3022127.1 PCCA [Lepeophtheirus salmonis]